LDRIELNKARIFKGEFSPPPDKSISHRAIILSAISKGKSLIKNLLISKDTESTINAFKALGVEIQGSGGQLSDEIIIHGKGLYGLREPFDVIDCGNSGTTIRLISGVLSGNPFLSILTGDSSLRTRPMARIIKPLSLMGADITGRDDSLLLAGLYSYGETEISEPKKSRDHTERMLSAFGGNVTVDGLKVTVKESGNLSPSAIEVPGDFSSAAFFIVASLLIPDSEITVKNVGINPTRTGLLEVLKKMGARIEILNIRNVSGEPVADICCRGKSELNAVQINEETIPSMIDEFPIVCIAAAFAEGKTTIKGAEELRVKESDRIKSITSELRKMGVEIEEYTDGLSIAGTASLHGANLDSYRDHRIAMALAVAALAAEGKTTINGASSADISFPGFFDTIRMLSS
jgi:3-phosphoshikimate 1-carboxyvinyltransferase